MDARVASYVAKNAEKHREDLAEFLENAHHAGKHGIKHVKTYAKATLIVLSLIAFFTLSIFVTIVTLGIVNNSKTR